MRRERRARNRTSFLLFLLVVARLMERLRRWFLLSRSQTEGVSYGRTRRCQRWHTHRAGTLIRENDLSTISTKFLGPFFLFKRPFFVLENCRLLTKYESERDKTSTFVDSKDASYLFITKVTALSLVVFEIFTKASRNGFATAIFASKCQFLDPKKSVLSRNLGENLNNDDR
jgi:hypothetical protein